MQKVVTKMSIMVRDTENLTFSADYHTDFPHQSVRCSAVVRTDNWQIPRRTCNKMAG